MIVYEMQKDFEWIVGDDKMRAKQYFTSNALVNVHLPTHTSRCFKKGAECFVNLPEQPFEETKILFNEEMYTCTDWCSRESQKGLF